MISSDFGKTWKTTTWEWPTTRSINTARKRWPVAGSRQEWTKCDWRSEAPASPTISSRFSDRYGARETSKRSRAKAAWSISKEKSTEGKRKKFQKDLDHEGGFDKQKQLLLLPKEPAAGCGPIWNSAGAETARQ